MHHCDTKIKFEFGSDRVKVKVKRGQNVKHNGPKQGLKWKFTQVHQPIEYQGFSILFSLCALFVPWHVTGLCT